MCQQGNVLRTPAGHVGPYKSGLWGASDQPEYSDFDLRLHFHIRFGIMKRFRECRFLLLCYRLLCDKPGWG